MMENRRRENRTGRACGTSRRLALKQTGCRVDETRTTKPNRRDDLRDAGGQLRVSLKLLSASFARRDSCASGTFNMGEQLPHPDPRCLQKVPPRGQRLNRCSTSRPRRRRLRRAPADQLPQSLDLATAYPRSRAASNNLDRAVRPETFNRLRANRSTIRCGSPHSLAIDWNIRTARANQAAAKWMS